MINLPDSCPACNTYCVGGSDSKTNPAKLYKCRGKIWVKSAVPTNNKLFSYTQYTLVFNSCYKYREEEENENN